MQRFEDAHTMAISASALGQGSETQPESAFVCVGDTIDVSMQDGFLRGHGTQVVDGKLMATLCGIVERVNKLVSVRPLQNRYVAELGDVVVGRVTDVAGKRWKVDILAQQEGILQLSAVNLPGGIQRRRTAEDELSMRLLYAEGDLISAEVQSFYADGAVALHTRSLKYGKLANGQLVVVPHNLIRRQKMHFTTIKAVAVDAIFGINGHVWIAPHAQPSQAGEAPGLSQNNAAPLPPQQPPTVAERQAVCCAANAVRALAALQLSIHAASVEAVAKLAIEQEVSLSHMLRPPFLSLVAAQEAEQRSQIT